METVYRLVGLYGGCFGIFETETEAEKTLYLYKGMKIEEYRIPYCIFLDMFWVK